VSFDDFRTDEEAKTGARNRTDGVCPIPPFEDMTAVRLRYADSVIADRNRRIAAVGADVDVDFSTVRRVFDRVADQILQNPLDAALVVIDHHRLS
jgi:hypothetical protein